MAKSRRTFTDEFKIEAVKLVTEGKLTYKEAARKLGISDKSLQRWKEQLDKQAQQNKVNSNTELEKLIKQLQKENSQLKLERDFLKKASAYFAKEVE